MQKFYTAIFIFYSKYWAATQLTTIVCGHLTVKTFFLVIKPLETDCFHHLGFVHNFFFFISPFENLLFLKSILVRKCTFVKNKCKSLPFLLLLQKKRATNYKSFTITALDVPQEIN